MLSRFRYACADDAGGGTGDDIVGDGRVTQHMMQGVHLRSGVWVLRVLYAVLQGPYCAVCL